MKTTTKAIAVAMALSMPAAAVGATIYEKDGSRLTIGAKFYVNATSSRTEGDGTVANNGKTQSDNIGLALDRAYLSIAYQFDDVWSMGLTTDTTIETALTGKKTNVYIKKAYARGKFSDAVVVSVGVIGTPWIGYEEGLHRHRYVFKSFVDLYGLDSSADAGIGLQGKLGGGMVQYAVTGVNGGGYGDISKTKSMDLNSRIGIRPIEGLTMDAQFRDGYRGSRTWDRTLQADNQGTRHTLMQGMITYGTQDTFRVGGNYIHEKSEQRADAVHAITRSTTRSTGYDAWAWVKFGSSLGAFGRYDFLKKRQDLAAADAKTEHYVAGMEYLPRQHVAFAVAADYSKTRNAGYNAGAIVEVVKYGLYSEFRF